jgi:hypothetical protein
MLWNSDGVKTTVHAQVESVTKLSICCPLDLTEKVAQLDARVQEQPKWQLGTKIKLFC